jgi:hypothetical protein
LRAQPILFQVQPPVAAILAQNWSAVGAALLGILACPIVIIGQMLDAITAAWA